YQQSHSKFFGFHSDSTFLFVLKIAKSIWFPFNDFQIIYEDPLSIMFLTVQSPVHLQGGSNDPVLPLLISEQNHRNPLPTFQCGYIPLHYIPSAQYTVPLHLIKMIRIRSEERRVGKEYKYRWAQSQYNHQNQSGYKSKPKKYKRK